MFIVIKKQKIYTAIFLIIVAVILSLQPNGSAYASVYFGNVQRLVPVYNVETEEQKVAISFDAAWGSDKTNEIMAVLKEHNANATFFLVGFWVEKNPELTKKIAENGFEIGSHSNMHLDMAKIDKKSINLDLQTSIETIKSTAGITPKVFRSPYGSYNNNLISAVKEHGMSPVQWNIDTLDWKGIKASEIAARVSARLKPGSIILCHNNADNVVEATKLIMLLLEENKMQCVSVSDLLLQGDTYVDNAGVQRQKI